MKHLFIINPAAGKGKTLKLIPEIERIFKSKNEEYHIEVTKKEGHATEIARDYSSRDDYRIYSVGGDGTLNEVLNGMAGTNSSLAVIPSGTGNDFIKSIFPAYKKSNVLIEAVEGKEEYIDIGKINHRYFINIASAGFDAEITFNTKKIKAMPLVSRISYILGIITTVFKYKPIPLEIFIDDRRYSVKTLLVAISNGKYYGGGILITPKAQLNDGEFEICLISEVSKFKILRLFPMAIKGRHSSIREVSFYRGKNIRIIGNEEVPVNIDGEVDRVKEINFNIIHRGIRVIMPRKG